MASEVKKQHNTIYLNLPLVRKLNCEEEISVFKKFQLYKNLQNLNLRKFRFRELAVNSYSLGVKQKMKLEMKVKPKLKMEVMVQVKLKLQVKQKVKVKLMFR